MDAIVYSRVSTQLIFAQTEQKQTDRLTRNTPQSSSSPSSSVVARSDLSSVSLLPRRRPPSPGRWRTPADLQHRPESLTDAEILREADWIFLGHVTQAAALRGLRPLITESSSRSDRS